MTTDQQDRPGPGPGGVAPPEALLAIPAEKMVHADVREELRQGREPFEGIMGARRQVPPGGGFTVRAIFEPVPLYGVMARQGFDHHTEKLADDDWRIWFYPATDGGERGGAPREGGAGSEAPPEDDTVILDVRGLEPPEPMVRTLAALEDLPPGATLVQLNARVPHFLFPHLEERGFTHEVREMGGDLVRVFIRRKGEPGG